MRRTCIYAIVILFVAIFLFGLLLYFMQAMSNDLSKTEEELLELRKSFETMRNYVLNFSYDKYGGYKLIKGNKTGFFHIEKINGRFWFIDPDGYVFLSKGVNHVDYYGDYSPALGYSPYNKVVSAKYGSPQAWAKETTERLRSWGFNTIGAWSSEELFSQGMPYTIILDFAAQAGANWQKGEVVDYFSERFQNISDSIAKKICLERKDDPYLIGYFTDNELRWCPDWRSPNHLFDDYMSLPSSSEGKKALVSYLHDKYKEIKLLNEKWGTSFSSFDEILNVAEAPKNNWVDLDRLGFLEVLSRKYFQVVHDAIRKYDKNHLILGCRYAFKPPDEAIKGCIGYTDVISINAYTNPYNDDLGKVIKDVSQIYNITGLPVMITEFSFKAMDSGLPNTKGAGVPVRTQSERAKYYEEYVKRILSEPFIVGYHWFEYVDEPAQGRFDGENSNYGLVDINDKPWTILVEKATSVNLLAEQVHNAQL
ncbi:MAG: beta-galactosidase [Thermoproteota archaeon]|jgi:agarase